MVSRNIIAIRLAAVGISVVLTVSGCATNRDKICGDRIRFEDQKNSGIKLNGNEELLVCGDPKTESWKSIPLSQSEFTLRQFLRNRAYFEPKFKLEGTALVVDPGEVVKSTRVDFVGAPTDFDKVVFRKAIGEPLNSVLLDQIQADTIARLKLLGYACPEAELAAIQETGVITVKIKSGPKYVFENPRLKDSLGMHPEVFGRFQAFRAGQEFTYPWIQLTQTRAELDGIVVSSQISYQCPSGEGSTREASTQDSATTPAHLDAEQQVIGGAPRLLTIGGGASTEEIPIFEIKWKSVRLDQFGSSLLASVYLSQRDQKAQFIYADYIFKNIPRLSFNPTFTFEHRNELTYESSEFQVSSPLVYKADYDTFAITTSLGPALSRVYSTTYGVDLADTYVSLIADVNFMTHEYELYQADPRSGTLLTLNIEALSPGTSFHPTATDIKFRGTHLFRLNDVEPHQWVFGLRYGFSTTLTSIRPEATATLPAQYYQVLGGDSDLRGFGRYELNNGTVGALSSGFMGVELRLAKTLPVWMEPFVFFDVGSLGQNVMALDGALYTSPGVGIRLSTPFGAIRSTFAHGFVSNTDIGRDELSHFQFFLSFGKEF